MLPKTISEHLALMAELDLADKTSDAIAKREFALKDYRLDKRRKELEKNIALSASFFLRKQHGILVGEKIPYSHLGVINKSGHLRVERIALLLKGGRIPIASDWFLIYGHRFKTDGKLAKREMMTSLPLDRAKCDA